MAFGGNDHPFYKPLGVRLAIIGLTGAWTAFEAFYAQSGFWTIVAAAVFAYAVWAFLIAFPKGET